MNPRRFLTLLTLVALALTACGDDDNDVTTTPDPDPPTGPGAEVVFQAATGGGGFVGPSSRLAEIPELSVYGDGRVITLGPTTLEFPGSALPNLQVGQLSAPELEQYRLGIEAAGLLNDPPPDYGDPGITDSPTTVVTYTVDGEVRSVSAYALDFVEGDDQLEPEQREARQALRALVRGFEGDLATETYAAESVAVFVRSSQAEEGSDDAPEPATRDWPLGDLAGAGEPYEGFDDTRCLVLSGADAQTALAAAADAKEGDGWRSGGAEYSLVFRPLLPNETSCADLSPEAVTGA
jgi:hypothetical protein